MESGKESSPRQDVDGMGEGKFEETKDELRERRIPFVIISGKNDRRGSQTREIQSMAGNYYICEMPKHTRRVSRKDARKPPGE